jgi:UDP-N-acetylmuramate--alanine ligase
MSNVATVLLRQGARVSGSDCQASGATLRLQALGAEIALGSHRREHLSEDIELVVASAAVAPSNPELREARRRGVEVISYAELVGRLMSSKAGIAVAGTHGKSTTTAMTAFALRVAGRDPTFVVGAEVAQLDGGSGVGCGPHFVVEACEYGRSFHHLRPRLGAVLNIEEDHLDYYDGLDEICQAFAHFAGLLPDDGLLLVNGDDRTALEATEEFHGRRELFGLCNKGHWEARNRQLVRGCYGFDVRHKGRDLAKVQLRLAGLHNVQNALAAFALAWHAGAKPEPIAEALSTFAGCQRRLSCRGAGRGVTLLDDYAHHPTEIRASLLAVRQRYNPKRLWVVFQPHQHSRTRFLLEDFARSFAQADHIIVPNIYFVRDSETERTRIGASDLVKLIRKHGGDALHVAEFDQIADHLEQQLRSGDLVVTMGAGDVWKVADELIVRLGIETV